MPPSIRQDRGNKLPGANLLRGIASTAALIRKPGTALTGEIRTTPDFLIVGAGRSGTTSLYYYLTRHPEIAAANHKEIGFFDRRHQRGAAWYRTQFPSIRLAKFLRGTMHREFVTGEATPYYLFHPHFARRAAAIAPRAKLIAVLRNPVDRAYSDHANKVARGFETLEFEAALAQENGRLAGETEKMMADENYYSFRHHRFGYRARGLYADQIQRLLRCFPSEQLLVVPSEELFAHPAETTRRVTEFLGIAGWTPRSHTIYNSRNQEPMRESTRKALVEFFEPHNRRLEELTGLRFDWTG